MGWFMPVQPTPNISVIPILSIDASVNDDTDARCGHGLRLYTWQILSHQTYVIITKDVLYNDSSRQTQKTFSTKY